MGKIGFDTAIWTQNLGQFSLYRPGQWITYLHLSYDPYGPVCAFITNVLRKSPYEGRMRWREQGRKKPCSPARIAYGPRTGILSIARTRCELKQLCCYINPDFSVKMSDVSEHSEFDYRKKKKEKRGGHIIKCLLTELSWAGRENFWPEVMVYGPSVANTYIIWTPKPLARQITTLFFFYLKVLRLNKLYVVNIACRRESNVIIWHLFLFTVSRTSLVSNAETMYLEWEIFAA